MSSACRFPRARRLGPDSPPEQLRNVFESGSIVGEGEGRLPAVVGAVWCDQGDRRIEHRLAEAQGSGCDRCAMPIVKAGANVSITNKRGETATSLAQEALAKQQAIVSKLQSSSK